MTTKTMKLTYNNYDDKRVILDTNISPMGIIVYNINGWNLILYGRRRRRDMV